MSRTYRATASYLSGSLYTAVTLIIAFISTPLLIKWLGNERFGAFRVLTEWFGYLGIVELGIGGALLPLLAKAVGSGDESSVRRTMTTAFRAYLGICAATIISGIVLATVITHLVPISPALNVDLQRGWLIALLGAFYLPFAPFRALIEATQRSYWIHALLLLQSLLTTAFALLFAWRGWGISGQLAAILLGGAPFHVAMAYIVLKGSRGMVSQILQVKADDETTQQLWSLNRPTLVFNVCGRVSYLTDGIVVAYLLGPAFVTPLFITQRLSQIIQGQLQAVSNSSWAALAELHTQSRNETFNQRVIQLTKIITILGVACLLPVITYNQHFVDMWTGSAQFAGGFVTSVACVNAYMIAVISLWMWCFSGTGQVRKILPVTINNAVVNLIASLLLTPRLGLIGPLLGTMIALLTTKFWYLPVLLRRSFGTSLFMLFRAVSAPLILAVPCGIAAGWLASLYVPSNFVMLILQMGIAAVLYLTFAWLILLTGSERLKCVERAQSFILHKAAA